MERARGGADGRRGDAWRAHLARALQAWRGRRLLSSALHTRALRPCGARGRRRGTTREWPAQPCGARAYGARAGQTASYLLPCFRHILDQRPIDVSDGPIAVIFTPARELCIQVHAVQAARHTGAWGVVSLLLRELCIQVPLSPMKLRVRATRTVWAGFV